jgi:hypothetical protein
MWFLFRRHLGDNRWERVHHPSASTKAKLCTFVVEDVEDVLIMCVRKGVRRAVMEKLLLFESTRGRRRRFKGKELAKPFSVELSSLFLLRSKYFRVFYGCGKLEK